MAVKLRLKRMGKKKQPIYKVVAADSRSPRDGKFIEAIGLYNPQTDPATINIVEDRALHWLKVGAQPTDTVKNLLSKKGILLKRDLQKRGLTEEQIETKLGEWNMQQEARYAAILKRKEEEKIKRAKKAVTKDEAKADESASEVKGAASDIAETEKKAD